MVKMFCVRCNKEHDSDYNWKNRVWDVKEGKIEGWGCTRSISPATIVNETLANDRKKYAREILQPFKGGELNKEFAKEYPEQTKSMLDSGSITKTEYDKIDTVKL